jgi:outer membrane lipoprotein-sorting protein
MNRGAAQLSFIILLAILAPFLMPSIGRAAEELPAQEIVERANLAAYYAGDDGRAEVTISITDRQGRTRTRELVMLRVNEAKGGDQRFYVYFERPTDVRGMVFLVHKHVERDDDRWLYLPSLDLVRRIAASDQRTSFAGSHFYYEDVSGRAVAADNHELLETTGESYRLKSTPKNSALVEFAWYTATIDRHSLLPVKIEYFDRQGRKYREIENLVIEEIQGYPTVVKSRARDLLAGGETVYEFNNVRYNLGLADSIFTERYLRRPPREVRRR